MSDVFPKKLDIRVGGWGEIYPFFLGFLEFFNFAKPLPYVYRLFFSSLPNFLLTSDCVRAVSWSVSSVRRSDSAISRSAAILSASALAYFDMFDTRHSGCVNFGGG